MNIKNLIILCLIFIGVFVYWFASNSVELACDLAGIPLVRDFGLTWAEWTGLIGGGFAFWGAWRSKRLTEYLQEALVELSKVVAPEPREASRMGLVVVVMLFLAAVILALFDYTWSALTQFLFV